jgi:hypothetical protein
MNGCMLKAMALLSVMLLSTLAVANPTPPAAGCMSCHAGDTQESDVPSNHAKK